MHEGCFLQAFGVSFRFFRETQHCQQTASPPTLTNLFVFPRLVSYSVGKPRARLNARNLVFAHGQMRAR